MNHLLIVWMRVYNCNIGSLSEAVIQLEITYIQRLKQACTQSEVFLEEFDSKIIAANISPLDIIPGLAFVPFFHSSKYSHYKFTFVPLSEKQSKQTATHWQFLFWCFCCCGRFWFFFPCLFACFRKHSFALQAASSRRTDSGGTLFLTDWDRE